MDIKAIKLVTGEDILGEYVSAEVGRFRLKNPVGIAVVRGPDGKPSVGFSPFPLHGTQEKNAEFDFDGNHVVYSYEPAEDYCKNYEEVFGSGIILPNKKLITE